MLCTWENCKREGYYPQKDSGGNQWAVLCGFHDTRLGAYIRGGKAKEVMRGYAKASAKKFIEKMLVVYPKGRY